VLSAAARMNHMIDALLSLSRLSTQPLQCQPVNLSQLARLHPGRPATQRRPSAKSTCASSRA
jgi:hypothetical protein